VSTRRTLPWCAGALCDVAKPAEVDAVVSHAMATYGQIDILVNNAAVTWGAPAEDMPLDKWEMVLNVNLTGAFLFSRACGREMIKRRYGRVINVASVAGMVGAAVGGTAHAATKGAIIAMTRQLAVEGAPHGIRVNSISPGVIESPGTAPMLADPKFRELMLAHNLIKRVGQPEDVVGLAVFLAGDDAAYITGTNMVVDGGFACW